MYLQCQSDKLSFPKWARKWINLRKTFSNFYDCKRLSLKLMLDQAGYAFEGSPHSGIDDSLNIARLVVRLLEDGCKLIVNERLFGNKLHNNMRAFQESSNSKVEVENLSRAVAEALGSDDDSGDGEGDENEEGEEEIVTVET